MKGDAPVPIVIDYDNKHVDKPFAIAEAVVAWHLLILLCLQTLSPLVWRQRSGISKPTTI